LGKAKILSHLGDGLYSIIYYRDVKLAKQIYEGLAAEVEKLMTPVYGPGGLNDQFDALIPYEVYAQGEFDTWLSLWAKCASKLPKCPEISTYDQEVKGWAKILIEHRSKMGDIKSQITDATSKIVKNTLEMAHLQTNAINKEQTTLSAWAVDRNDDTGTEDPIPDETEVGTIETYGVVKDPAGGYLPAAGVNLLPHTGGGFTYDGARDRIAQPIASNGVYASANNYAQFLFASMTKRARYLTAKVTGKPGGNTLNIECYGATPSQDTPSGELYKSGVFPMKLNGVPVSYMSCGAGAFKVDDWVIVQFSGDYMTAPTVIGFVSNPKGCPCVLEYSIQAGGALSGDTTQDIIKGESGTPVTINFTDPDVGFTTWTDGRADFPTRQDVNVTTCPVNVTAQIVTVSWPATFTARITNQSWWASGISGFSGSSSGDVFTFSQQGCTQFIGELQNNQPTNIWCYPAAGFDVFDPYSGMYLNRSQPWPDVVSSRGAFVDEPGGDWYEWWEINGLHINSTSNSYTIERQTGSVTGHGGYYRNTCVNIWYYAHYTGSITRSSWALTDLQNWLEDYPLTLRHIATGAKRLYVATNVVKNDGESFITITYTKE
jgi:hypothetical protein